jgi:hypothetical protein
MLVEIGKPDLDRDRSKVHHGLTAPQDLGDPLRAGAPVHLGIDLVGGD